MIIMIYRNMTEMITEKPYQTIRNQTKVIELKTKIPNMPRTILTAQQIYFKCLGILKLDFGISSQVIFISANWHAKVDTISVYFLVLLLVCFFFQKKVSFRSLMFTMYPCIYVKLIIRFFFKIALLMKKQGDNRDFQKLFIYFLNLFIFTTCNKFQPQSFHNSD